jgi:ABC-type dipeptide/oligopeptide/nickel transport system permease subunit
MTEQTTTDAVEFSEMLPSVNPYARFLKVFFGRKVVTFGFIIIVGLLFSALFAQQLAPYDPYEIDLDKTLLKPNWEHLLGTDALGRDTLSRIIYGTRTSLMVGFIAIAIASSVGMTLGLLAGYFGGLVNMVIMRLIDALMAFPIILKALIIAALLGGGLKNVMIALGVGLISVYARLMCGQVLSVRENDYVMAGQVIGASNLRVMLRHVLPNCFPPLIVMLTLNMGAAILAEAGLSFLGIGIEAPGAAWGSMVADGYQYLLTHPVLSFAPGFAIMLVVLAFNLVGDGLRDALDPRLRGMI